MCMYTATLMIAMTEVWYCYLSGTQKTPITKCHTANIHKKVLD